MSLHRSLLLLVVVVACIAHLCAAQWPCPDPDDILPCVCSYDEDYNVDVDCSNVTSSDQLTEAFLTPFPFNDLRKLTINPSDPFDSLLILPANVFEEKTFQEIEIINTFIHTVEEEALVNSHPTLNTLYLASNEISDFPFETLDLFEALRSFTISNNKLSGPAPDLVTESLLTLDLSGNTGFMLSETTFVGAVTLEILYLNNMGLDNTMPAGVFTDLIYLSTLELNNNDLSGTLIEDFINNNLQPLTTVELNGNSISSIHALSVTGMDDLGTISFMDNQIEYLEQEDWGNLASELTQDNAIDVRSNPLVCGCDLMWLVFDEVLMAKFHSETTCVTGNYIVDLPQAWFLEHCP